VDLIKSNNAKVLVLPEKRGQLRAPVSSSAVGNIQTDTFIHQKAKMAAGGDAALGKHLTFKAIWSAAKAG